jgi:hypothetical protein
MFSNDGTLWRTYCVCDPISTYCGIVDTYWVQIRQFGYLNRVDTIRFRIVAWRTDTIGSYWVPKHNRHQSYCVPPLCGWGWLNAPDCVLPQSDPIGAPHLPYTIRHIVADINLPYYSASTILRYTIQYDILIVFIIRLILYSTRD